MVRGSSVECNSASVEVYGKNITFIRRKILKRCLKFGKPLQTYDTLNNEFNEVEKDYLLGYFQLLPWGH
jgi:hypothetical protein